MGNACQSLEVVCWLPLVFHEETAHSLDQEMDEQQVQAWCSPTQAVLQEREKTLLPSLTEHPTLHARSASGQHGVSSVQTIRR